MNLTTLIDTYRGPLIGLIASWGATWTDAADIAQDSFSEAWLRRESCRGDWQDPQVFGRWLRGIALNQYRNWSRGRRRRGRVVLFTDATQDIANDPAPSDDDARLSLLRSAIERLPSKQRQVVLMHYLEATSVKEVAAILRVSVKTVEGRLYQARRNLHRALGATSSSEIGRMLLCL